MDYDEQRALARAAVRPLRPVDPEVSLKRLAKASGLSLKELERRVELVITPGKSKDVYSQGPIRVVKPNGNRRSQHLTISGVIESLHAGRRLVVRIINSYFPRATMNQMFKKGGLVKCRVHKGEERLSPRGLAIKRWDEYEGGEHKYGTDIVRAAGGPFIVYQGLGCAMAQLIQHAKLVDVGDYTGGRSAMIKIPAFGNRSAHELAISGIQVYKGSPTLEQIAEAYGFFATDGSGKANNFIVSKERARNWKIDPEDEYPREDRTGLEVLATHLGIAGHYAICDHIREKDKGKKNPRKVIPVFPKLSKRELLFLAKAAQFVLVEDPLSSPSQDLYDRLRPCNQANLEQLFYDFRVYQQRTKDKKVRAQIYHDGKSGLWSMLTAP